MTDSDRPYRRRPRLIASTCAALAVLALPAMLYARAGGGHSYSGSGSGGHGGGGGGGDIEGLFELIYYILRFCFYYPKIGFPLLVIVIAVIIYVSRKGKEGYIGSVIRRAARDRMSADRFESTVRANDPAFTVGGFVERVSGAFGKIQEAWSRQDLSSVRPFLSDAVHERFGLQFDEQRSLGYRNVTSDVRIESITLAGAYSDAHFDHLDVRIVASATDQNVSLADGRVLAGSGPATPRPFAEVWSFLRRRGATTRPGAAGLMEGNCPNCGAAIEMNQNANCGHCGALLRSGQYDWVLTEITQEFEWRPGGDGGGGAPGVRALAKRDPGFNVQELEDRASVVFWRKATADRLASVDPLRKSALPEFCERYEGELRGRRGGGSGIERTYFGECAVGSVDVRGIRPADTDVPPAGEYDRALVEVRWSGTRFTVAPGRPPQRHEQSAVSRMLLVLARRPGVQSDPDKSISSAHCPTCGAPDSGGTSGVCDFCGATLNDGSIAWALEDAMDLADPRARQLMEGLDMGPGDRPASAAPGAPGGVAAEIPSSAGMLAWMVKASLADGELDARERALLESVAARHRVPPERLEQMIAAARSGTLDVPAPAGQEDARENLRAIAYAALADGRLAPAENALLRQVARRAGVSDYDVSQLLRRARKELYADARQQLRAARNGANNGNGRA